MIGAAATDFAETLKGKVDFVMADTLENAVQLAARDATSDAVVLLSPACASFDQYKNFEVRGDAFVAAVAQLPGAIMASGGQS